MITLTPLAKSVSFDKRVRPLRDDNDVLDTEVIVVGTGAGGAAAGTEMALAGKRVLFLESGGAFTKKDFEKRSLVWSLNHLYQQKGMQIASGKLPVLIMSGQGVGGSTLVNAGICFRPPAARKKEWAERTGQSYFLNDAFSATVEETWKRLGVVATHAGIGRRNNEIFELGSSKLSNVDGHWMDRNAAGCVGCGICHMGCPSGGKASVDKSILPAAVAHGAQIRTHARVEQVLIEGGRARGVIVAALDPESGKVLRRQKIRADVVIVAASALRSPMLLEESGVENDELGKHLAIHPGGGCVADFEEPVHMWNGALQGYYSYIEGNSDIILETVNVGPGELFALFGRAKDRGAIANRFKHFAMAGGMVRDRAGGRVVAGGNARPKISYDFVSDDVENLKEGISESVRVFFAAGAKRVAPLVSGSRFYDSEKTALDAVAGVKEVTDFAHVHASHPHGSCRMGARVSSGDVRAGVVDGDGKVHGHEGLYVMDGSIFPTTLGVNPQITIVSLSAFLARRLVS